MASVRLKKELKRMKDDPVPLVLALPLEKNILEWRFVLKGAISTDYAGGHYHGKLKFPSDFPFAPPSIMLITPSGRFVSNARICFSMSDFHPESWNPMWSIGMILTGLLSFMNSDEQTTGSIDAPSSHRKQLAACSKAFNDNDKTFREVFGDSETVDQSFNDIELQIAKNSKKLLENNNAKLSSNQQNETMETLLLNDLSCALAVVSPPEVVVKDLLTAETVSVLSPPEVVVVETETMTKSAKKRLRKKKAVAKGLLHEDDEAGEK